MSYESFVKAVETYLPPTNTNTNGTRSSTGIYINFDLTTSKIIHKTLQECNLLLDDIIFFDPTQTKKMVKSQANFIATGTHCLQGDTGTNTSTTNII